MSFIGKLHEISLYSLITAIICVALGKPMLHFLLVSLAIFIIIAIIGAFCTKNNDGGEGLTFTSQKIVVIIFAHIAEELLGLIVTPFWLIIDLIKKNFHGWKAFDYITYFIEVVVCLILIWLL